MAVYLGKYAQRSIPAPTYAGGHGQVICLEATESWTASNVGIGPWFNTGGTLILFKIPAYARIMDVRQANTSFTTAATCLFAASLQLIVTRNADPEDVSFATAATALGNIFTDRTTDWNASTNYIRDLAVGAFGLAATDLWGVGATFMATATARDMFTGASAVFNVSASVKYLAMVTSATAQGHVGPYFINPSYLWTRVTFRMADDISDNINL